MRIVPPWTVGLTSAEHDLVLLALGAAALALLATVVRQRFAPSESHGSYRMASLTANSVVAIAFVSYLGLAAAFLLGYRQEGSGWSPLPAARLVWELRYLDWIVTVPLLVVELIAVSALTAGPSAWLRRTGIAAAVGMVLAGFLGAFVVADGRDFASYALWGGLGAVCFAFLYGLIVTAFVRTVPRLPLPARGPYRAAMVVLLVTWFAYPAVYGLAGVAFGGAAAAIGQVVFSISDVVAKVGFGTLVHRTAVYRSRAEEQLDPSSVRRLRQPQSDSIWVDDRSDLHPDH